MTQKKIEETEKGRDVEEKVNQPKKFCSRIEEKMKKILYVFLITFFSLTIFSCAKKDGSSGTATSFWSEQIGTSSYDNGTGVTLYSSDNIYVSGQSNGGLDGNINSWSDDIFLVKYNSSGTKQWTKKLGIFDNESGVSMTVDSSDNIYVTGYTKEGYDGNSNSENYDIFLMKYNSSGTKQWTKQLGNSAADIGMGVTVDSSDNIYVTGIASGGLDRNTGSVGEDIVLVKYNSSGTKQWTKQLGSSSSDFAWDVTVDSSDNIYVTGFTNGSLEENFNQGSYYDIFLVKYNSDGVKQ